MSVVQISDAELEVMKVLWEKSPLNANEVCELICSRSDWAAATVKTLLGRLVRKGAVKQMAAEPMFLYKPQVRRDEYLAQASSSFLGKFFDGATTSMLSFFVKNNKLSTEEMAQLRKILEEAENS